MSLPKFQEVLAANEVLSSSFEGAVNIKDVNSFVDQVLNVNTNLKACIHDNESLHESRHCKSQFPITQQLVYKMERTVKLTNFLVGRSNKAFKKMFGIFGELRQIIRMNETTMLLIYWTPNGPKFMTQSMDNIKVEYAKSQVKKQLYSRKNERKKVYKILKEMKTTSDDIIITPRSQSKALQIVPNASHDTTFGKNQNPVPSDVGGNVEVESRGFINPPSFGHLSFPYAPHNTRPPPAIYGGSQDHIFHSDRNPFQRQPGYEYNSKDYKFSRSMSDPFPKFVHETNPYPKTTNESMRRRQHPGITRPQQNFSTYQRNTHRITTPEPTELALREQLSRFQRDTHSVPTSTRRPQPSQSAYENNSNPLSRAMSGTFPKFVHETNQYPKTTNESMRRRQHPGTTRPQQNCSTYQHNTHPERAPHKQLSRFQRDSHSVPNSTRSHHLSHQQQLNFDFEASQDNFSAQDFMAEFHSFQKMKTRIHSSPESQHYEPKTMQDFYELNQFVKDAVDHRVLERSPTRPQTCRSYFHSRYDEQVPKAQHIQNQQDFILDRELQMEDQHQNRNYPQCETETTELQYFEKTFQLDGFETDADDLDSFMTPRIHNTVSQTNSWPRQYDGIGKSRSRSGALAPHEEYIARRSSASFGIPSRSRQRRLSFSSNKGNRNSHVRDVSRSKISPTMENSASYSGHNPFEMLPIQEHGASSANSSRSFSFKRPSNDIYDGDDGIEEINKKLNDWNDCNLKQSEMTDALSGFQNV